MLESISLQKFSYHYSPILTPNAYRKRANFVTKSNHSSAIKSSPSVLLSRCRSPDSWLTQENTVGIIGGLSVIATLIFLEKIVFWSSRNAKGHIPFIVCSDPAIKKEVLVLKTALNCKGAENERIIIGLIAENLMQRRVFLEESGARCIVMPCHMSHLWYRQISKGCSVPFLDVGECVAMELKEANMKPIEAGNNVVRIGVLAADSAPICSFYQEKLHSQGFECILPDKHTTEQMIIPMVEALNQKDMEGARNLLRIAIQVLLVRGVNVVILAADEFQGLLPCDDPLLKKCIDPMDALARSTIKWAQSKTIDY